MNDAWSERRKLLVLSDMHLGKDCKEITGFKMTKPDEKFDQAFIDMLDHYTSAREDQWRLIIDGDFIDFVEVVVAPKGGGPGQLHLSFDVSEEERAFGLGTEAERSLVKLDKTFEYHSQLFLRLSHFIREGGQLMIIRGNHDVEFHWRKVQRIFRRKLAGLAFSGLELDVDEVIERRDAFQNNIQFSPWIYYEKDRIYVEHGHQYDPYCSFDHQLYPVSPTNPREIDTPLFMFAMRYFVNMLTDYSPHHVEIWTTKDYLLWLKNKGPAGMFYTCRMAFLAGIRMLVYAGRFAVGRVRRYHQEHNKKLGTEAARFGIPLSRLERIDALHHVPVNRNLSELMRLLFLDRILLAAGALTTCLFALVIFDSTWLQLLGIALTAIAAYVVNRKMAPRRFLLPGPKQVQAAKRISRLLKVPLVVMGHSHMRRVVDLGRGRRFVNTGCWLPPFAGKDHVDPNEPCTCAMTHLVVDDTAELRIFCKATRTVRVPDVLESSLPEDRSGALDSTDMPLTSA